MRTDRNHISEQQITDFFLDYVEDIKDSGFSQQLKERIIQKKKVRERVITTVSFLSLIFFVLIIEIFFPEMTKLMSFQRDIHAKNVTELVIIFAILPLFLFCIQETS